jgi:hypothetical protein
LYFLLKCLFLAKTVSDHVCVKGIEFATVSTTLWSDLGIVPTYVISWIELLYPNQTTLPQSDSISQ